MRRECHTVFDIERSSGPGHAAETGVMHPKASFVGFLNQQEICQAYVSADCLVLPSEYGETWGLVVNEAMASGLPCVISDQCGSSVDLGRLATNRVFKCGDAVELASRISELMQAGYSPEAVTVPEEFSIETTVSTVVSLYGQACSGACKIWRSTE